MIGLGGTQRHTVQHSQEWQMADSEDQPAQRPGEVPSPPERTAKVPAKRAAAKVPAKIPAKKAPTSKAATRKAPAKKATATKRPAKKAPATRTGPQPALKAAPPQAALTAGAAGTHADDAAVPRSTPQGDYRLPVSLGLAAAGLVALVLSRLRRG